jgi:hypothetical protein
MLPVRFKQIYGNGNYRGGKIRSFASMKEMKEKYGIKRIVNLAYDSMEQIADFDFNCGVSAGGSNQGNSMPSNACEPLWAKELGIELIVAPYWWFAKGYQSPCIEERDCPITDALWKKVRNALTKGHTYIHCSAGVDRTSAIVSRWTLEADPNATPTSVIADAESYKHGWANGVNQQHYFDDWILEGKPSFALRSKVIFYQYKFPIILGSGSMLALILYLINKSKKR